MREKGLVSVIMPVGDTDYLNIAMESILDQTYREIELIIVDGTDEPQNVRQLIDSYNDERIKYLYREKNGISDALNYGIQNALGIYIARMDSDDISLTDRIQEQVRYFNSHPEVEVVGSCYKIIDENGEIIGASHVPEEHEDIKKQLIFGNCIGHPTVMFRRKVLEEGWRYANVRVEDYDLWTRMIHTVRFANIQDELILYRRHSQSLSNVYSTKVALESAAICKRYISGMYDLDLSGFYDVDFMYSGWIEKILLLDNLSSETYIEFAERYIHRQYELLKMMEQKGCDIQIINNRWIAVSSQLCISNYLDENLSHFFIEAYMKDVDDRINYALNNGIKDANDLRKKRLKVIIYGFGSRGQGTYVAFKKLKDSGILSWDVVGVVDRAEHVYDVDGIQKSSLKISDLSGLDYDNIIITSPRNYKGIISDLIKADVDITTVISDNVIYYYMFLMINSMQFNK